VEKSDNFIIEIPPSKVESLTGEFGGDYELMAKNLKIMKQRMVLLNPVNNLLLIHFY